MGALDLKPIKFLISVGGIYISYIYFGLIMERLFNSDYSGQTKSTTHDENGKATYEKFTFGFATSIFQNILSFLVAMIVNRVHYKQTKSKMDLKSELLIAGCSFGSVFMAAQALAYISFPVQALMKSSKIISILIVSFLLGSKASHTKSQYFCGFIITLGIIIFNLTNEKKKGEDKESSLFGLIIILGSLFCDGLIGTKQTEVKKKFNPSAWDQMESLNKWAGLICLGASILSLQIFGFVDFIIKYPAVLTDLVLLALLGTFGQIFIFYTIFNFSPLVLSIVTTTRKFFTVLASIVIYRHHINQWQILAIALVFLGVFVEMLSGHKKEKKHDEPKYDKLDTEANVVDKEEMELVTKRNISEEKESP
jgi:UDP-galactose transporter B1